MQIVIVHITPTPTYMPYSAHLCVSCAKKLIPKCFNHIVFMLVISI